MKKLKFTKMHGTGNDFVVLDAVKKSVRVTPALARRLADRRFGVGADQILVVGKSKKADFSMRIFNADGSEVEMCGNGIRCAALLVRDRGYAKKDGMVFDTPAGLIRPRLEKGVVRVDMGEPILDAAKIPTRAKGRVIEAPLPLNLSSLPPQRGAGRSAPGTWGGIAADARARVGGGLKLKMTCVSMGNPHCVIFVDDLKKVPVEVWGPALEHHRFFPRRVNVEFVEVTGPASAKVRVWERGAGLTMACGTGACAVAVAGVLTGRFQREVTLSLPGGDLGVEWGADNHVYLTGPAVFVYEGVSYV